MVKDLVKSELESAGRSPHGERGLKLSVIISVGVLLVSLPTRGAWIEMHYQPMSFSWFSSLPTRGAWIEIYCCFVLCRQESGRSPHGERGLKYRRSHLTGHTIKVAPHTGSVD